MVKFFIIADILPFVPLVIVSFCHSFLEPTYFQFLEGFSMIKWQPPHSCNTRLWYETHDGNLEAFPH